MTIAHRLTLLLAVPLVVLIGLGVLIANRFDQISRQSRFVAEAQIGSVTQLGKISRSVTALRVDLRNHLLAEDKDAQAESEKLYRQFEEDLDRQLAVYGDTLISDSKDQRFFSDFSNLQRTWRELADQIFALSAEGRRGEAGRQTVSGRFFQAGRQLNDLLVQWSDYHGELAANSGKATVTTTDDSKGQLLVIIGLITLFSAVLGFLTLRSVVRPIHALQASVQSIAGGDFTQNVPFTSATDETGGLARSIDVLKSGAAAMEEQRWVKASLAKLAEAVQDAPSIADFGQRFLTCLMPLTGGGVAGLYLFHKDGERLDRIAGYGLDEAAGEKASFRRGEALVGQCADVKSPITLTELPPDYVRISSGVGSGAPKCATAWPLLAQNKLLAVLELASFAELSSSRKSLLDEALPMIALSLEVLERNLATQELLGKTQEQARELEEQTEELTTSQEELLAQKEELLTQQEELMGQREQIKASEERTRLILDFTAEGIFGTDTNGRITFVNPAACQLLGFTADELLGQPSHAAPQKVMVELLAAGTLERGHLAPLRVHAREDVLDCPVLAGRVHGLKDEQHGPLVLGVE